MCRQGHPKGTNPPARSRRLAGQARGKLSRALTSWTGAGAATIGCRHRLTGTGLEVGHRLGPLDQPIRPTHGSLGGRFHIAAADHALGCVADIGCPRGHHLVEWGQKNFPAAPVLHSWAMLCLRSVRSAPSAIMYYVYQTDRKSKGLGPRRGGGAAKAMSEPPKRRLVRMQSTARPLQPFGRFAWGTGSAALALFKNSTVANTSSVSPMFSRSCTLNSPLR